MAYKGKVQLTGEELNKEQICIKCGKVVADWITAMKASWTVLIRWGSRDIKFWPLCPECAAKHRKGEQGPSDEQ